MGQEFHEGWLAGSSDTESLFECGGGMMIYLIIWRCGWCEKEVEMNDGYHPGSCECGGTFTECGESYDQEFVDQERYEMEQDREYEERHGRDGW